MECNKNIRHFLNKTCENLPTLSWRLQLEDIYIDDGSVNEINFPRVSSSETPRSIMQKRCKSAEINVKKLK